MKIIFLNRFFFPDHSATSQMLTDLAFYLAGRGWAVHVITGRQRYDDPAAVLPARETVHGVIVHRVWTSRFGRANLLGRAVDYATFYFSAAVRLLGIAARGDVVVAKTDPPLISVVAGLCARWRGARLVNWLQDVFPEVAQALGVRAVQGLVGRVLRGLRNRSLRAARMNVALGERMATVLEEQGVVRERIAIIPNWADGAAIRPLAAERNPLRQEWGLQGKFVVGYSGNLGRAHEFETLLGAAELLQSDPAIVFLVIGAGHGMTRLEQAVHALGLCTVLFRPYQPRAVLGQSLTVPEVHLVSLLPELEGYIVPSKYYGVAAAGRPVVFIGAADGELAVDVERAGSGLSVRPGDARGLAEALQNLRNSPTILTGMGQAARSRFEDAYDMPVACAAWERLFTGLQSQDENPRA